MDDDDFLPLPEDEIDENLDDINDQEIADTTDLNGSAGQDIDMVDSNYSKTRFSASRGKGKAVLPENRVTTPYMTKYEKARILGTRSLQIRQLTYTFQHAIL